MHVRTYFTSTTKYQSWVAFFTFFLIAEVILFLFSGFAFINANYKYNQLAIDNKIKGLRRMQRLDTEYEQFLFKEKEKIQFLRDGNPNRKSEEEEKADNNTNYNRAINSSVVEEDEVENL